MPAGSSAWSPETGAGASGPAIPASAAHAATRTEAPSFPHGLPSPFFLAPVAGYSDAAFRSVCSELGAGLCYTEMVSSEGLTRDHPKTKLLLARSEAEPYYAIQLFGSKPDVLARAAEAAAAYKPVCIDLNCGCPVPKIIKSGAGSALLKDPARIAAIVRA
ncbi:MAG TPA: tRNA-dihydrouridine synthase, partial [Rectinemataceae bacterium]